MRHLDEYRRKGLVRGLAAAITAEADPEKIYTLMEVCGTHTMSVARSGLRSLLPKNIRLLSGPGCPVCVTGVGFVDAAVAYARRPDTIVCTFGDLVKVPGSSGSLARERARGADIHVLYSPAETLPIAAENPDKLVVFLGVGFETTTPTVAALVDAAVGGGVKNFALLSAHKTMPNALRALCTGGVKLDGFLLPGHVSVVTGLEIYRFVPEEFGLACAVTGFEAADILSGILALVRQVNAGEPKVQNAYPRAVTAGGNPRARALVDKYFQACDADWRGLGVIPGSGLELREEFADYDALKAYPVEVGEPVEPAGCRCGDVLRGLLHPTECPLFERPCNPGEPLGACMVSNEGACAAAYRYGART
ncbi:MAG: hydrogenase formation protein HypD [Candidatus Coatesbacteria bacterium RBG_13_66_14]|uniref:Hydrogenase formation protein HypD n=1 Tax=Candidatus Coatesbacteria bacterium RBG_13_66_14 TaxID=1817816 RepID=A0A1F5EVJ1_9BACT|nr:MAG: hydrogenase formation protein HypD [Candidatus Coatesbacteria bacterium RBG_13_66_14]